MSNGGKSIDRETWILILIILAFAFLSLFIRLKVLSLDLNTLAFVGVPTVLAVVVALSGPGATLESRYLKNTTLGLLVVGILAAEKFAFLLVIAPLAWLLAYVAAGQQERQTRARTNPAAHSGTDPATTTPAPIPTPDPALELARIRRKQFVLVAIVLTFTIVSLIGRVIYMQHLEQTSVMFIGVPSVLALLLAVLVRPKSALGAAMTGISFVLLLSAILFGEGVICIIMAAPIFYVVGAIIGVIIDNNRKPRTAGLMLITPFLLMSLAGSRKQISLPREQTVISRAVVDANAHEVEAALAAPMQFRTRLPFYLRLGFPRPVSPQGSGLAIGDSRSIHFAGGEGKPGDLVMQVAATAPGTVTFQAVSDHSKVAHWLHWEDAVVSWRPIDACHTEVVWSLHYRRDLDPSWYFGPWERYGVGLAADYLIQNLATPALKAH